MIVIIPFMTMMILIFINILTSMMMMILIS